ncbi:MAG: TPM domain-containing protein [Gammaproteobacteria bacterium]|nr:TPM domain-containing protein [Gammaproteobacteria bacterium]
MAFLSEKERRDIAQAIAAVEAKTRGELVTVIARAADDYLYVPLLWAALLALAIPGALMLAGNSVALQYAYEAQVAGFLLFAPVLNLTPVKMRLTPRALKRSCVRRLAREQFFAQNLHRTTERAGVLLFVSVAERSVEILADDGIHRRVPAGTWERAVAEFTGAVQAGRVAEGFLRAIQTCGDLQVEHFPARPGDKNELPDHLIEL